VTSLLDLSSDGVAGLVHLAMNVGVTSAEVLA